MPDVDWRQNSGCSMSSGSPFLEDEELLELLDEELELLLDRLELEDEELDRLELDEELELE